MGLRRRQRKKLIRKEVREMDRKANQMVILVNAILDQEYKRTIPRFSNQDKLRLLIYNAWSYVYKVPIRFILTSIVPYFLYVQKKSGRFRKYGESLGIPVSHITGRKAKELLEKSIGEVYPNRENIAIWKQETIQRVISSRTEEDEELETKQKNLWDFDDPEKFFRYYASKIREERDFLDKFTRSKTNKLRKYRGNPFIS